MEKLNCKSLMIDDWVSYNGTPIKVENVYEDCINFQHDIPFVQEEFLIEQTEIEPIPLTPEILEKNGLECKHKGESLKRLYWILNVEGGSVKVKVNRGLFLFDIHGVPFQHGFYLPSVNKHIQYVHDLQHAFRLCGITREIIL